MQLNDTNRVDFTVTSDPASRAPGRFYVVFKSLRPVPVGQLDINAQRLADKSVSIQWSSSREESLATYQVEKSRGGNDWVLTASKRPIRNDGTAASYSVVDTEAGEGLILYRIKAVSQDGRIEYSRVARVLPIQAGAQFSVYPNPVRDKKIYLHFTNLPVGQKSFRLLNSAGQVIWQGVINGQAGSSGTVLLSVPEYIPAGHYRLIIGGEGTVKYTESIVIQ